MRSPGIPIAAAAAVLFAGGAVGCFVKAHQVRAEAGWLLERGTAQAQAYAQTFESAIVEQELATFEQRRAVLDRAHLWQQGVAALLLLSVLAALAGYGFFIADRLRYEIEDLGYGPVPVPVTREEPKSALPQPAR